MDCAINCWLDKIIKDEIKKRTILQLFIISPLFQYFKVIINGFALNGNVNFSKMLRGKIHCINRLDQTYIMKELGLINLLRNLEMLG